MIATKATRFYSLDLFSHAINTLASAITPLIAGILLVGVVVAVIQGAFQVEDNTLALGAKLAVVLLMASGGVLIIFLRMAHLTHDWISHIPMMISRSWS